MKISVIGTGYVGLVTGVCLAERGHMVVCVDVDPKKIEMINGGVSPIFEAGLEELLKKNLGKRFRASLEFRKAVVDSDVTFVAVGTPFGGREIDLTYVEEATRWIGTALRGKDSYHLVVVKSTVVPGTTDRAVLPLLEQSSGKKAGTDLGVGMNPEFLTEGQAIEDFMQPDRIVLGGIDERSVEVLDQIYSVFPNIPKVKTNTRTAEMIKYASNAMLATQISFSNELANFSQAIGGIDIVQVMEGLHLSNYLRPRTSGGTHAQAPISSFLFPGCGFGGSCLPKDVKALAAQGEKFGQPMSLMRAVLAINDNQPDRVIQLLSKHFTDLNGAKIAVLGLAFKPDTDDMRESPSIPIVNELLRRKAAVSTYDPAATSVARLVFNGKPIKYCQSLEEAIAGVDAIVLVTRWEEFRNLHEHVKGMNPQPLVVDGRRFLEKSKFQRYEGIGM